MRYYFLLQYKRIYRIFKDFGAEPFIGYPIITLLFYWVSSSVFENILYANYIYVLISTVFAYAIGDSDHNNFIKQHFSTSNYRKIMVLSNMLKVTPFAMFLLYKTYYTEMFLVYVLAFLVSLIKKRGKVSLIISTPFGKKPAEFVIGFRKTFWLFLLIYGLAAIAIYKGNFNLGIFSLVSIFFVCSSYYMKSDPDFYIWVHAMNSKNFVKHKIVIALRYSFMLTVPILFGLSIFYLDQIYITLLFLMMGWLYLIMYLLMKYAFQQEGLEVFQGIIGVLCLLFPPIMILVIPYFYKKAINNLDLLLK